VTGAGGYSILQENGPADIGTSTYKSGWTIMGTAHVWWRLHAAGEYGVQFKPNVYGETQRLSAVLGGVRISILRFSHAVVYGQTLVGVEMFREPGFEESGLAIQPGAGIDWRVWKQAFIRGQVDYRWAQQTAGNFNELRFFVGGGIAWGR
jgi:hypothetical protein